MPGIIERRAHPSRDFRHGPVETINYQLATGHWPPATGPGIGWRRWARLTCPAMSDPRLATIGELLGGAPEHLVERSAAARAEARGVAVEEVLAAWSGGGDLGTAPAVVVEAPAPAVTEAPPPPSTAAAPVPPPASTWLPVEAQEVATVDVDMAVEDEPEDAESVEPAPLAVRIRLGVKVGAAWGAPLGLVSILAAAPLLLGRLSETTITGGPAIEVTWTAVAAVAVLWAAAGAVVNVAARAAGRFLSAAYDTNTSPVGSALSGGFMGLVLGAGLGGLLFATAESSLSGTKLVPISSITLLGLVAAGGVLGAVIGGTGQAIAQPSALGGAEAEDAEVVRRRIADGLALPVIATLLILVIVVSFGSLLVRFASFAPLIAILVSIGALGFAALMASRPNLRVTRGEVLLAAAGVGVVLLMLALIASSMAGPDGSEEVPTDHAAGYAVHI